MTIEIVAGLILVASGGACFLGAGMGFYAGYKKGQTDGNR